MLFLFMFGCSHYENYMVQRTGIFTISGTKLTLKLSLNYAYESYMEICEVKCIIEGNNMYLIELENGETTFFTRTDKPLFQISKTEYLYDTGCLP